ncbi:MAG TPA: hypothetical protein VHA33_01545 [Candidatus Angelobacter sp.]|jgi:hypothetical protein|nr:hypothetical protein [Candidatus Angelobacter sp.]
MTSNGNFMTGSSIRQTGIYSVSHTEHRLPKQVFLVKNGVFPRCAKCTEAVTFTPVLTSDQSVPNPVYVRELPVMDEMN